MDLLCQTKEDLRTMFNIGHVMTMANMPRRKIIDDESEHSLHGWIMHNDIIAPFPLN